MKQDRHISCRNKCADWEIFYRKNGAFTRCKLNKHDLPSGGIFNIPYWCPKLSTYNKGRLEKHK